jgi:hypothetical protein
MHAISAIFPSNPPPLKKHKPPYNSKIRLNFYPTNQPKDSPPSSDTKRLHSKSIPPKNTLTLAANRIPFFI